MYLDAFIDKASTSILEYKEPMKYLASRGFGSDDIKRWGIGYTRVARVSGAECEDLNKLKEATHGFRNLEGRIIIPLRNILGRVNGIQTRSIDTKVYKDYLMSEAKNMGTLFGLREALPHIRSTRKVFVHEGAFNAMAFSKVFPNTVASLTSFLSDQQVELLRFLSDLIVVVFDNDKAGDIGRAKVLKTYGSSGFESITIGESDSNACLTMMGPDKFTKYIKSRVPTMLQ